MTDTAFISAVEASDSYRAAAIALDMPYHKLYERAQKLRAYPKAVAARRARKAPVVPTTPEHVLRQATPGAETPILSAWRLPPDDYAHPTRRVLQVRLDQRGRVRAAVYGVATGWVSWAVYDCNGDRVGKPGIDGTIELGRGRVDRILVELGWLHEGQAQAAMPCGGAAPTCSRPEPPREVDPIVALAERLLAAKRAERGDLGVELAKLVVNRVAELEAKERAA